MKRSAIITVTLVFISLSALFVVYKNDPSIQGVEKALFTWTDSPATTFNVIWLVREDEPTRFRWGLADGNSTLSAKVKRHSFHEDSDVEVCQVNLTGLRPATTYRVVLGDNEFLARTLPEKRPDKISFVAGGDMMKDAEMLTAGVKAMASRSPDFALLGGDLAYANAISWKKWLSWIEVYSNNALRADGLAIPFVVAIGNHEVYSPGFGRTPKDAPMFYSLFPFPKKEQAFYTVDLYDDLSVIVLDSSHTHPVESQVDFIRSSLSSRRDRLHLFALYHAPACGVIKGGLDNLVSMNIRNHWIPLFDEYDLDCAFENDHHLYKRSKLLRADKVDPEGTLYIGDGAWGVDTRKPEKDEYWYVEKIVSTQHVIEVEIKNNVRTFRAIDHAQKVFDEFVDNRDAFNLEK